MDYLYWNNLTQSGSIETKANWSFDAFGFSPCDQYTDFSQYILCFRGQSMYALSSATLGLNITCGGIDFANSRTYSISIQAGITIDPPSYETGIIVLANNGVPSWFSAARFDIMRNTEVTAPSFGSAATMPQIYLHYSQIRFVQGIVNVLGLTDSCITIVGPGLGPSVVIAGVAELQVTNYYYNYIDVGTASDVVTGDGTLVIKWSAPYSPTLYSGVAPSSLKFKCISGAGTIYIPDFAESSAIDSIMFDASEYDAGLTTAIFNDSYSKPLRTIGGVTLQLASDYNGTDVFEMIGSIQNYSKTATLDLSGVDIDIAAKYVGLSTGGHGQMIFSRGVGTITAENFQASGTWNDYPGSSPIEIVNTITNGFDSEHTLYAAVNVGDMHVDLPASHWAAASTVIVDTYVHDGGSLHISAEMTVNEDFSFNSTSSYLGSPSAMGKLTVTGTAEVTTPVPVQNLDCRGGSVLRCQKGGAWLAKHERPVINSDLPRFASA